MARAFFSREGLTEAEKASLVSSGAAAAPDEVTDNLVTGTVPYANGSGGISGSTEHLKYTEADKTLHIGVTASMGGAGLALANNAAIKFRNSDNNSWVSAASLNSSGSVVVGATLVVSGTPAAIGQMAVDQATGRLLTYSGSAVRSASHADELPLAGEGLVVSGTYFNVGAGHGITVNTDDVTINIDGTTLSKSASGLKVANSGVTPTQLSGSVAGNGLVGGDGTALAVGAGDGIAVNANDVTVNIDGATLSKSVSGLKVADAGVTATQLAASVAGAGLTGGNGTALAVGAGTGISVGADSVSVVYGTSAGTALEGTSDAVYVKVSGSQTIAGAKNFTTVLSVSVDDATTNAISDVALLTHTTTGTAANGIGTGLVFRAEDSVGNTENTARVGAIFTSVTDGSETGALTFSTRNSGSGLVEHMRLGHNGGLMLGTATSIGAAGIGLGKDIKFYMRNWADTTWRTMISIDSSEIFNLGATSHDSRLHGQSVFFNLTSNAFFISNGTYVAAIRGGGTLVVGNGSLEAGQAIADGTIRAPNALAGTFSNTAGGNLTITSGRGTGNAANSYVSLQGSLSGSSGTTAHTMRESFRAYGNYVQHTGGHVLNRTAISGAYTALASDYIIAVVSTGSAFTVTLPSASVLPSGQTFIIKDEGGNAGTNNITISLESGSIDGVGSTSLNTNYGVKHIYSNGTNYFTM